MKKVAALVLVALVLSVVVGTAAAFQDRGSIRGTVYEDKNRDGKCTGTGDPILKDIPIKFVSDDGKYTVFLQSGANGTYGLVAAGFGTWTVSAEPPSGYVVTSKSPQKVFLGSNQLLALGVDFCVAKGTAGTVLPESGAAVAPIVVLVAGIGASMMLAGAGFEWRKRAS